MIRCGACLFFDCGLDCKCVCHNYEEKRDKKSYNYPKKKAWTIASERTEQASLEGLSSLFG